MSCLGVLGMKRVKYEWHLRAAALRWGRWELNTTNSHTDCQVVYKRSLECDCRVNAVVIQSVVMTSQKNKLSGPTSTRTQSHTRCICSKLSSQVIVQQTMCLLSTTNL